MDQDGCRHRIEPLQDRVKHRVKSSSPTILYTLLVKLRLHSLFSSLITLGIMFQTRFETKSRGYDLIKSDDEDDDGDSD